MAKWCRYCEGSYPFYCSLTGSKIQNDYYCKQDGYGCPIYYKYAPYYIASTTCHILHKKDNDKVYGSIRILRDEYLEGDPKYSDALAKYDAIAPNVAVMMIEDKKSKEVAEKVYSVLERISSYVNSEKIDEAVNNYEKMVEILVDRYSLVDLYEKKIKKLVKKPKTLD